MKVEVIQDCVIYPDGVTKKDFKVGDVIKTIVESTLLIDAGYAKPLSETRISPPKNIPEKKKRKSRVRK